MAGRYRASGPARRCGARGEPALVSQWRCREKNKLDQGFDPVTAADTAVEDAIRRLLAEHRPDDGIVGEEGADTPSRSGRTWIIDPIDGTRAFLTGLPSWCVLIALTDETGPVLSVIDQPFTGERFFFGTRGSAGLTAHL